MIEVANASVVVGGRSVLRDLDLFVAAGECVALVGENGAGKTTLIRMLAGELHPYSGSVRIAGYDTSTHVNEVRYRIGVVPHANGLYPLLTVEEHLLFFGRLYGLGHRTLRGRIDELLEVADLVSRRRDATATLSAGMARRLGVVCALVHEPLVLLMDEPTDNMDARSRDRLYAMVQRAKAARCAVVTSTHDPEDVRQIADRIVGLQHGLASVAREIRLVGVESCGA